MFCPNHWFRQNRANCRIHAFCVNCVDTLQAAPYLRFWRLGPEGCFRALNVRERRLGALPPFSLSRSGLVGIRNVSDPVGVEDLSVAVSLPPKLEIS